MHYQIHDRTTSVDLHLKCWSAAGTAQSCFETGRRGIRVAQITRQLLHHIVKSGDTALGSPHGACMHAILPLAISPHAPLSPIRTPSFDIAHRHNRSNGLPPLRGAGAGRSLAAAQGRIPLRDGPTVPALAGTVYGAAYRRHCTAKLNPAAAYPAQLGRGNGACNCRHGMWCRLLAALAAA